MKKLLSNSKVFAIAFTAGLCMLSWDQSAKGADTHRNFKWQRSAPVKSILDAIAQYYKINLAYENKLVKGVYSTYTFVPGRTSSAQKVLKDLLEPLGLKAAQLDEKTGRS